jgi:hypothetical protein
MLWEPIDVVSLTLHRVSEDRELNLVLLRLVEYLGHTNQIASGAAFNEVGTALCVPRLC